MFQVPIHLDCGKPHWSYDCDDVLITSASGLQNRELLEELLNGVITARDQLSPSDITLHKPKIVLKIAPDLDESQLIDIADVIKNSGIDGVIVSNTTVRRPSTLTGGTYLFRHRFKRISQMSIVHKEETGGLSGVPLKQYSLAALRTLRTHLPASIPLFGCGGISTGADALEYAKAGAALIQVYTSFGYDGAGTCRRIKDELVEVLNKEGKTWEEVVRLAVGELSANEVDEARQVASGEASVSQLIEEAQELHKLLDNLGDRMGVATLPVS